MKQTMKYITILLILVLGFDQLNGQELAYLNNSSFNSGEVLKYKLKYGFITAAEASLRVLDTDVKFENQPTYHLLVQGKTSGTFDIFYKVRNRYDSYINKKDFAPYLYTENIQEENYRRTEKARFYQDERKIVANKGTFKSPVAQTFDLVSAYYFARNLDLSGIKAGDKLTLRYFLSDEITPLTIEYLGKEVVRTSKGKLRCLKFRPSISPGRIFKKDSQLFLWITDDANRIPVKAEAEVLVGSITMELSDARGLRQPLQIIK
ncbi:DUF3108 domain-containing protein [Pedobacter glucosidilyticus]|uniref:DUF3108 domain-containing protein n=1 Tax=Pedobacter glucosidilyticus TaxID=1122941 RepID=UPI0003FC36CA|nr:DUF3108 domain-containing protein [Pedobacter glucosidilyticus]